MVLSHRVTEWKGRFVRSVKKRGLVGTTRLAITGSASFLIHQWKQCSTRNPWNPWYQFLDRLYDRRFAVNTAGIDLLPEISNPAVNAYSPPPLPRSTFVRVLRQIRVDHSKVVFIDFGCGKGKALLLASELPFKAIIGLELLPRLARAAEENVRTYRGPRKCTALQVACIDAVEYAIPNEPAICYFYDPFGADVMAKVLDNIRRSLAAAPRELVIFYLIPSHRHMMDNSGFLMPGLQTAEYCIYYAGEAAAREPGPMG